MDDLFDEVALVQKNFGTIQSTKLFTACNTTSSKWRFILKSFNLKCANVFKIVSFVLSIPGTSAYCERFCSIMSFKWRSERNKCSMQLMKSELLIYFNLKNTRREFSEKIKRDLQLLKSAKNQKKCLSDNMFFCDLCSNCKSINVIVNNVIFQPFFKSALKVILDAYNKIETETTFFW